MSIVRSLRRLLRVLTLEEEQAKSALDSALAQLRHLESKMRAAAERERNGRRLVSASAHSSEVLDRFAALEEIAMGRRTARMLQPCIVQAEQIVVQWREVFMCKRIERLQAETLLHKAEARDAAEAIRRSQQVMDDWYLVRRQRNDGQLETI